ncbi:hypothetical protein ACQP06_12905 [Nocardia sp. CA-136227]|uniref:hypothetical protein n=1 Tax=Nocardia sp. CA-136227 TaxID=3239979 RepID=UPI003D9789FD
MTAIPAWVESVAKNGRAPAENEDRAGAGRYRFAVADGATDSARAEVWADILVEAFIRTPVTDIFDPIVLARLREQWWTEVDRPGLPWHATRKLREQPGAAAFVGIEVDPTRESFAVTAVGDSCALHIRQGELLAVGPVENSRQFGSYQPCLVKALADAELFRDLLWHNEFSYQPGDVVVLASDALAKYLLRCHEADGRLELDGWADESAPPFTDWVARARAHDGLDNDDTTVCVVML